MHTTVAFLFNIITLSLKRLDLFIFVIINNAILSLVFGGQLAFQLIFSKCFRVWLYKTSPFHQHHVCSGEYMWLEYAEELQAPKFQFFPIDCGLQTIFSSMEDKISIKL